MIATATGDERASALRRYNRPHHAEDLADLPQKSFDAMLNRAREDWEQWKEKQIIRQIRAGKAGRS